MQQILRLFFFALYYLALSAVLVNTTCDSDYYIRHYDVTINPSDCYSYETYAFQTPSYMCIMKCDTIPGCIATGSDSQEMTSTCCTFVDKNIDIFAGDLVIIYQSDVRVCLGSDWTAKFTSPYPTSQSDFSFKLRFAGFGQNCLHFTGKCK